MLTTIDDKRAKRIMMGLLDGDRTNELLDAACNKIVSDAQTIQALNDVIEQQDAALARLEAQLAELNRARFAPGGAL